MIREEEDGFHLSQELKCQTCGIVLMEMDVYGETAIEASHSADLIRNEARCVLHQTHASQELLQEIIEDMQIQGLLEEFIDEYGDD